jgi:hypothetical protein
VGFPSDIPLSEALVKEAEETLVGYALLRGDTVTCLAKAEYINPSPSLVSFLASQYDGHSMMVAIKNLSQWQLFHSPKKSSRTRFHQNPPFLPSGHVNAVHSPKLLFFLGRMMSTLVVLPWFSTPVNIHSVGDRSGIHIPFFIPCLSLVTSESSAKLLAKVTDSA